MTYDALASSRAKSRPVTLYLFQGDISSEYQLENQLHGVTMIPGTTEFGYGTTKITKDFGGGNIQPENWLSNRPTSDFSVALDQLIERAPNLEHVSLVVAWHGTDLRIGECQIKPKVEIAVKTTTPRSWQVGPVTRGAAEVVSYISGFPAIGGAPADWTVYEAITAMKAKGLRVTLYPFVMMDVPSTNSLPNPYSDNAAAIGQSAYPWRGRITISPAAGFAGSPDKTSAAADQVAAFFGTADASDFGFNNTTKIVTYSGPNEWSFRRFMLHMATIANAAGADDFICGSEMVGMTTIRSGPTSYPAVAQLIDLVAEVRSIVGSGVRLSYGADWSEYHSHRPGDGSNDVIFHLDPLWANSNIDYVGVDNYLPISDWRDGDNHLDLFDGWRSIYDVGYLEERIEGGENYDWYYASDADRNNQVRSPITDGLGKPWIYRNKDFRNWWANEHRNRPNLNRVANAGMAGAVVGNPGTLPEGWARFNGGGTEGSVEALAGAALSASMDYRVAGDASGSGSNLEVAPMIPTEQGDQWTFRVRLAITEGTTANFSTVRLRLRVRNSANAQVGNHYGTNLVMVLDGVERQYELAATIVAADAAKVDAMLEWEHPGGEVGLTVRIKALDFRRTGDAVEDGPTAWVPQSKPIIFTELGCPAVNKGANQPNLFIDPKSSESDYPHFSNHRRDTLTQRAMLEAWLKYWAEPGRNPISTVTGKPMLEMESAALWTWDSRPFPTFPRRSDFWGDAASWEVGHWLNGRLRRIDDPVGKTPYYAYTDAERPFTFRGIVYQPIPIRCGNVNASGKLDKSLFEVRVPRSAPITELFRAYPPSQPISLVLRQGHINDPNEEFLAVWTGRVLSSSREDNETIFACEPTSSSLRRPGLRRNYQIGCPYVLYGAGCFANKAAATRTATVASLTPSTVTLASGWNGPHAVGKFAQGMIEWETSEGTKEIRRILRISGNTLTLSGLLRGLSASMSVSVILGCNHQISDCASLHNNIQNYGGCPTIPTKNPLSAGVNNFY